MVALLALAGLTPDASAQIPRRQIPPAVLAELARLESRFELALYADCDAERCYSRGCTYVDHAVIDQPRSTSMPGFGLDPGPGSVDSQEFLTQASCSFAHEPTEDASDIQALVRRLQAKVSTSWTVVSVDNQALQPIPDYLRQPPSADNIPEPEPEPELEEIVEAEPDEWLTMAIAGRELWHTLLPHFFWMIAIGLASIAGMALIWAWRRVGRDSLEEQLMLAQLTGGGDDAPAEGAEAVVGEVSDDVSDFVAQQDAAWRQRLAGTAEDGADEAELEALIHELLRSGDMPLLAKAVLTFPRHFPAAFPSGGEVAAAKLALADYLKTVDVSALPADDAFFESLNRHALSAALTTQSDARIVRSLREDFGAAGLVAFIADLPARPGALLFALSPVDKQHEMVQLLSAHQAADLSEELLRSDRMDPLEADYIFEVLRAARGDAPLPPAPNAGAVLDRGSAIDAASALSVLLPKIPASARSGLFDAAMQRLNGSLPEWYRGIFTADMLLSLSAESRADLMLEIDIETLAAWMSIQDAESRADLLDGLPNALRASVGSISGFASRAQQLDLARQGRAALSAGFQRHLSRSGVPFEQIVRPEVSL